MLLVLFEVLCGKQAVDSSIDEEQWGLATWAQDTIKEGRLKKIVDSNLRGRISPKCLKQRPTMAEVVVGHESILALQEKTESTLFIKLFGRRVPPFLLPSNQENLAGGTSLQSLDIYLYTVGGEERIVHRFDINTIVYATENFSEANKISLGNKSMYKGRLQNGQDITITQYSDTSDELYKDCINEASLLVKIEQENVIQLLGYSIGRTAVYLVYDFAPNATLASLIFDPICNLLDWNKRYKIILGVARALVYLHNHAPVQIIHCDVTAANVLLDENFDPKLSGFKVAVTVEDESEDIEVDQWIPCTEIYISQVRLSTKADVYSFGVLVLETVTGQRAFQLERLANDQEVLLKDYVEENWLEGTLSNIIDPRIDVDIILMTKVIEIGLLCVQKNATVRPTMEEVVDMLLGTSSLTLPVSEMRSRMTTDSPPGLGWFLIEDYDYQCS